MRITLTIALKRNFVNDFSCNPIDVVYSSLYRKRNIFLAITIKYIRAKKTGLPNTRALLSISSRVQFDYDDCSLSPLLRGQILKDHDHKTACLPAHKVLSLPSCRVLM